MPNPTHQKTNIAALVFSLTDTGNYPEGCNAHITPDGAFRSDDGRPASMTGGTLLDWQMNAAIAATLIADLESSGKPILYDYEHNSMWGDSRAAGWIVKLVYVAGRGLFGKVEWTPDAAEDIAKKVYRYSSPLFSFDAKTGAVTKLFSVALTNNPALGDLGSVDLARRAALAAMPIGALANQFLTTAGGVPGNHQSGESMTPEQLAALTAERDGLKTNLAAMTAQVAALTAERDDLKNKVDAVEKAQAAAALAAEKTKHADLLQAALTDGRLVPAQKAWAEKQPLAALTEFLDASGPLPLTQKQADGGATGGHGLSQAELAMCSKMGVSPEDFKKAKTPA